MPEHKKSTFISSAHLIQYKYNLNNFKTNTKRLALQVVVVGVLGHSAVEERPCQVVHGILLVLHGLCDNLCIEVVVEAVIQVRLHWQRLVQELLEEVLSREDKETVFHVTPLDKLTALNSEHKLGSLYLLRALTHDHTAPLVILHGPVRLAHHLEDVIYGIIHISGKKRDQIQVNVTEKIPKFFLAYI